MKKISLIITLFTIFLLSACDQNGSDNSPHLLGKSSAPVLIEEFSDVECPACSVVSPQVEKLARNNSDIVQLKYYHFPLSYHKHAFTGAEAAECAGDQGKFWEYLGLEFKNQKSLSDDFFYTLAKEVGLNEETFRTCLEGQNKKAKVVSHLREGQKRQIPGTPSLFVNGQIVKWSGYEEFEKYVKSLVK